MTPHSGTAPQSAINDPSKPTVRPILPEVSTAHDSVPARAAQPDAQDFSGGHPIHAPAGGEVARPRGIWQLWLFPALAVPVFHGGWQSGCGWLLPFFPLLFLPVLCHASPRRSFYLGVALGLALMAPQLGFFWSIFGAGAVVLWGILAFWLGLFAATGQAVHRRLRGRWVAIVIPVLWVGFEYFRSELYYLRFAWITLGHALSDSGLSTAFRWIGYYGIGAVLFVGPSVFWFWPGRGRWLGLGGTVLGALCLGAIPRDLPQPKDRPGKERILHIAGAQVEGVHESQILPVLNRLIAAFPNADLIVLPEYALEGSPDDVIKGWCRTHRRHLVVGGKDALGSGAFRNTAWVIDPGGDVTFRQTKSVPIQFFDDGEAATTQAVWQSPWGAMGIAICYDLSYTRVMDRFIQQGAEALLIPTMDSISWGAHQHALHSRIAPVRAAEYGVPIVRSASSGVSQIVDATGQVTSRAPFSEDVLLFGGSISLRGPGTLPMDRWFAPAASLACAATLAWLVRESFRRRRRLTEPSIQSPT